jgi:tetratricopeptide (TPR) repeat protein
MAGRFSNLEVTRAQQEHSAQLRAAAGEPVRGGADHLRRAVELFEGGEFEPALQHYTRALGVDRTLVVAWVGQVRMLIELGECLEARMWAEQSIELFRGNGDLLAARAHACLRLRDFSRAMAVSDASVAAPGSSAYRWIVRGEVMLCENQPLAKDCFRRALAEPESGWFERVTIARCCLHWSHPTAAVEYATEAVGMRPGHHYPWFVLGEAQRALGLSGQAYESFQRSVQIHPKGPARLAQQSLISRPVAKRLRDAARRFFRI